MKDKKRTESERATREAVFKAADALHRDYVDVTINAVREYLGGGSQTPISKYLNEWKAARKAERATTVSRPPESEQLWDDLWRVSTSHALAVFEKKQQETKAALERLEHEILRVTDDLTAATARAAELSNRTKTLDAQLGQRDRDLAAANASLTELRSALAQMKEQYDALARNSAQQIADIRADKKVVDDQFAGELGRSAQREEAHQLEVNRLQEQIGNLKAETADLRKDKEKQVSVLQEKLGAAHAIHTRLESELGELRRTMGSVADRNLQLERETSGLRSDYAGLQNKLKETETRAESLAGQLRERSAEITSLTQRIGELNGALNELRSQKTPAEHP